LCDRKRVEIEKGKKKKETKRKIEQRLQSTIKKNEFSRYDEAS
jgi:hypothetical protein